jgi:transcriptional regulator with XRE-family HTH domain
MFHTKNLCESSENETIFPMPKKERIPNNLRRLRIVLGLTQEEFGKPFHKTRADISRYESGDHLTLHVLSKIKEIYGFTWQQMLDVKDQSVPALGKDDMTDKQKIEFLMKTVNTLTDEIANTTRLSLKKRNRNVDA